MSTSKPTLHVPLELEEIDKLVDALNIWLRRYANAWPVVQIEEVRETSRLRDFLKEQYGILAKESKQVN